MKFPATQKLSDEAVAQIMEIVTNENFKARVRQATDLFNSVNPDFRVSSPEFIGNGVISVMQPKHEDAVFQISVDEVGNEAIRKAREEGYAVQFSIISTDAPDPLESVLSFTQEQIVTLIPHPDKELLIKISFLNENSEILYEEESITFYSVRPGIREKEYRGVSIKQPIGYVLIQQFDFEAKKATGNLLFHCSSNDPVDVKSFHDIHDVLRIASKIVLTDLKTGKPTAHFQPKSLPPISEIDRRFVNAACNLKQNHNIHIPVPTPIDDEQLFYVEFADQILTDRKSIWKISSDPAQGVTRARDARKIVEQYVSQGYVNVTQEASHIELGIGDVKIDLGMLRTIWRVSEICNLEEIQEFLSDQSIGDEDMVNLEVEFDPESSFTIAEDS